MSILAESKKKNQSETVRRHGVDFILAATVLALLVMGSLIVISSSVYYSTFRQTKGSGGFWYYHQIEYLLVGLAAMVIMMNFDYRKLGKLTPLMMIVTLILLVIPLFGRATNGARRWIDLGPVGFQPSEVAKMTLIMTVSWVLSRKNSDNTSFKDGIIRPFIWAVPTVGLVAAEPHKSGAFLLAFSVAVIMFIAGIRMIYVISAGVLAAAGLVAAIYRSSYGMERVYAFFSGNADTQGSGYQVIQGLYAIGSGGWFGKGLMKSVQKLLYLPEPYNDFILSTVAEEMGFVGVALMVTLFALLVWRGFKVAACSADRYGTLLATGFTSLIAIEMIINMAVATGSVPATGMPLPFFSYGGTALVLMLAEVGILLNVSRYTRMPARPEHPAAETGNIRSITREVSSS